MESKMKRKSSPKRKARSYRRRSPRNTMRLFPMYQSNLVKNIIPPNMMMYKKKDWMDWKYENPMKYNEMKMWKYNNPEEYYQMLKWRYENPMEYQRLKELMKEYSYQ